ncbi:hypothetical protein HDU76_001305 [Blyttiomyces sp. JEL0837]|nr:hypothetical protein HDU76_001305 [Blyttiomyces sp. JEL0837]
MRLGNLTYSNRTNFSEISRNLDDLFYITRINPVFYQNITGLLKGQWTSVNMTHQKIPYSNLYTNASQSKKDSGYFNFNSNGIMSFHLHSNNSVVEGSRFIEGFIKMKGNGIFGSGLLVGVHGTVLCTFDRNGSSLSEIPMMMLDNEAFDVAKNVTLGVNAERVRFAKMRMDEDSSAEETVESITSKVKCGFNVFIQLLPVPHKFKAHQMEEYEDEQYHSKTSRYTVLVWISSFVELYLTLKQMEYTATQSALSKVSIVTVGMMTVLDAYLCLLHFATGAMIPELFLPFVAAAFFKFTLFSIFEMRYLLDIARAQRRDRDDAAVGTMYSRFCTYLVVGVFFFYQFAASSAIIVAVTGFVIYSFWTPQIISNIQRNSRKAFLPQYLYGMTAIRLLLPLYFYGCPRNVVSFEEPHYTGVVILIAWVLLQLGILYVQDTAGPRVLIPERFYPQRYDYHPVLNLQDLEQPTVTVPTSPTAVKVPPSVASPSSSSSSSAAALPTTKPSGSNSGGALDLDTLRRVNNNECAICFTPVFSNDVINAGGTSASSSASSTAAALGLPEALGLANSLQMRYMVTPCHHLFHTECLERWMEVKFECPRQETNSAGLAGKGTANVYTRILFKLLTSDTERIILLNIVPTGKHYIYIGSLAVHPADPSYYPLTPPIQSHKSGINAMIIWNNIKFACEKCQTGHRNSTCDHLNRKLVEIKGKGRPVTQCQHCRSKRKSGAGHSHHRCLCGDSMGDRRRKVEVMLSSSIVLVFHTTEEGPMRSQFERNKSTSITIQKSKAKSSSAPFDPVKRSRQNKSCSPPSTESESGSTTGSISLEQAGSSSVSGSTGDEGTVEMNVEFVGMKVLDADVQGLRGINLPSVSRTISRHATTSLPASPMIPTSSPPSLSTSLAPSKSPTPPVKHTLLNPANPSSTTTTSVSRNIDPYSFSIDNLLGLKHNSSKVVESAVVSSSSCCGGSSSTNQNIGQQDSSAVTGPTSESDANNGHEHDPALLNALLDLRRGRSTASLEDEVNAAANASNAEPGSCCGDSSVPIAEIGSCGCASGGGCGSAGCGNGEGLCGCVGGACCEDGNGDESNDIEMGISCCGGPVSESGGCAGCGDECGCEDGCGCAVSDEEVVVETGKSSCCGGGGGKEVKTDKMDQDSEMDELIAKMNQCGCGCSEDGGCKGPCCSSGSSVSQGGACGCG